MVAHVVVIGFPYASHAVKLFRVARALAAAAPTATFSFVCTATVLHTLKNLQGNLRLVELPEADGEYPGLRVERFITSAEAGGIREAMEAARAMADGARVTCVVSDALLWMAAGEAAAVGATWVPVFTGGPSALLAHLRGDALRRDHEQPGLAPDSLLTSHLGLGDYRVRDIPPEVMSAGWSQEWFRRIAETLAQGTAVAINTFQGLIPPQVMSALTTKLGPNCLAAGPFHLLPGTDSADTDGAPVDPHGCLTWLDGHPARAVAYVSFGTIAAAMAPLGELLELAAGLEASGKPFLWSLPEECWPQLPPGFMDLERAKLVPWAPQVQVLRHASVGAFVMHAGWASVLEAVCSGVSMACRPFFGDQMMNARLLHVQGLGATIDQPVTRTGVASVVASLLSAEEEGDRIMWTKMQELRGMAVLARKIAAQHQIMPCFRDGETDAFRAKQQRISSLSWRRDDRFPGKTAKVRQTLGF